MNYYGDYYGGYYGNVNPKGDAVDEVLLWTQLVLTALTPVLTGLAFFNVF